MPRYPSDPRLSPPAAFGRPDFESLDSLIGPYLGDPTSLLNQTVIPDDSLYPGDDEQARAQPPPNMRLLAALLRRRK